jgi:hypothetical protein
MIGPHVPWPYSGALRRATRHGLRDCDIRSFSSWAENHTPWFTAGFMQRVLTR